MRRPSERDARDTGASASPARERLLLHAALQLLLREPSATQQLHSSCTQQQQRQCGHSGQGCADKDDEVTQHTDVPVTAWCDATTIAASDDTTSSYCISSATGGGGNLVGSGGSDFQGADDGKRSFGDDGESLCGRKTTTKKRPRSARLPTYYVRKKEKESLQLQVQLLHTQLASLKSENQWVVPKSTASPDPSIRRKEAENDVLRVAVQNQQLSFAQLKSLFSGSMSTAHVQIPFQTYIRLGKDWSERHEALLGMKDKKLQDAQRYLVERTKFLDRSAPFAEFARFNTADGDLRALRLDITLFEGVASVKQVFDALMFYALNMEISISEILGDITIREDDGVRLRDIFHNRFVSNVLDDVQVECNTVMFCKLYGATGDPADFGGGREFAVVAADFVNDDERFPFSPSTRLRHDITAALTVTLEPRTTVNALSGEEEEELVVVLTRAAQLNLRRTDLPVPAHVMQDLRARIEGWGDAMLKTLRGILYPERPLSSCELGPLPKCQRLVRTTESTD